MEDDNDIYARLLNQLRHESTYNAYAEMANYLDRQDPAERKPALKVSILRNFTLDPIIPVLKGEIALSGFYPEIYLGDYDAIALDALEPDSPLYQFKPDIIIVALWLESLSPILASQFLSHSAQDIDSQIEQTLAFIKTIINEIRLNSSAQILVNNFPLPTYPTLGILDGQSEDHHSQTILQFNQKILQLIRQFQNVYLVNYLALTARHGSINIIDHRYWHMGKAPLSRKAMVPVGQEYGKFFRALKGTTRKCLVLDCDNTLWGGIVGEVGINGIELGADYPGSCFLSFQQEILNLYHRGIILALCSKNNQADVLEVLQKHPNILLKEKHFAAWQINWDDKSTNLKRISAELNIALDSLVFVDDNYFECDLVRQTLPEVAVLHLPQDPSGYSLCLSKAAFFDTLSFSGEDRNRTQMYKDQTRRRQLEADAGSLEEYLTNLEMEAEIGLANDFAVPRIAQLTQKTNQFNLKKNPYSEGDIQFLNSKKDVDVFYLKLQDRVSDMGLIGVAIVKYSPNIAKIDTFLLSCRVIGRGVEQTLLAHLFNRAKQRDVKELIGQFQPTIKNQQTRSFYKKNGFNKVLSSNDGELWSLGLQKAQIEKCPWITVKKVFKEEIYAND